MDANITYTITSTDSEHYDIIRTNLQVPRGGFCHLTVTNLTTKASFVVLDKTDYIVINDQKIISAGVLLPLTDDPKLSWKYGTRHRAAIGMTKVSDSACLVVSEETGDVSIALDGILKKYDDIPSLKADLESILGYKKLEAEHKNNIFNLEKLITIKKHEK